MDNKRKPYKKISNKKTRYKHHRKAWTAEDIEHLKEKYGKVNTEYIAKTLGRTTQAVRQKAQAMFKNMTIYEIQANYSLKDLGQALGRERSSIMRSWIKQYDMPVIKMVSKSGVILNYIIELDNFWEWLKNNKENVTIEMDKVDLTVLDFYPDWFLSDVENKNNYQKINRKKWSKNEVETLHRLYYKENVAIKEIALLLNRTYSSTTWKLNESARKRLTKVAI